MKKIVAFLLAIVVVVNVLPIAALAEKLPIAPSSAFQSDKAFKITNGGDVAAMSFGSRALGQLTLNIDVIDEAEIRGIPALVIKSGTPAVFSYTGIKKSIVDKASSSKWHIDTESNSKVEWLDFKDSIKSGAIAVEKSMDGENWAVDFTNTNVFDEVPGSIDRFYTARRMDLNYGCFYRVTFLYKIAYCQKQSQFFFVDTSTYERSWHTEIYTFFLMVDEEIEAITLPDFAAPDNTDVATGAAGIANQTAANEAAAIESITDQAHPHGFAAEAANVQAHAIEGITNGSTTTYTGADNAKNGADYIITSADGTITQIQCKYYSTASKTISSCFEEDSAGNVIFRYLSDSGKPMTIEVPADQYDKAVLAMSRRIEAGQVPGVTDPSEASNIVQKGVVTYQQAVNIAKAGTIESLVYDATTGCVSALSTFGISALVQYGISRWNGDTVEAALKSSLRTGLRIGGNSFVTHILASQLTRTSLNSLLVPGSEAVIHAIGPKAAAVIVNAGRVGMTPIYGAAAMKSAAKLLRGNVIANTVALVVFTVPDLVEMFRGRMSGKQVLKGVATTAGGLAGAAAGAAAGSAAGTAIFPGIGTTIGGVVGAFAGGMGASLGTSAVADLIAEDDADEMLDIVSMELQNLAEEYLLNESEATTVLDTLQNKLTASTLKNMFAAYNRHSFARNIIEPIIKAQVSKRAKIVLPSEKTITSALKDTLEEIYDEIGLTD